MDLDAGKVFSTASLELDHDTPVDVQPVVARAVAMVNERAPLYRGYPTTPRLWADMVGMVSLTGKVQSQRLSPAEIQLTSETRFVAGEKYNQTLGLWFPLAGAGALRTERAPDTLSFTDARGEVFARTFQRVQDTSLKLDLGDGLLRPGAFTVSAVVSVLPASADQQLLGYWDFDRLTMPDDGQGLRWVAGSKIDHFYGGMGGSVDPIKSLTSIRPLLITTVIEGSDCTTYVSPSPMETYKNAIRAKAPTTPQIRFQLGSQGCDFRLFELNLWSYALTYDQVNQHHSDLFGAYGSEYA